MHTARRDRLKNLSVRVQSGNDPVLEWLVNNSDDLKSAIERCRFIKVDGTVVASMDHGNDQAAIKLYNTTDGASLSSHAAVPSAHSWVSDGTRILTGSKYIDAVQVRCNSLFTKGRVARGRPTRDTQCTLCED